jgi:hypothetical protein
MHSPVTRKLRARLVLWLFFLGLVSLGYLLGAAVIYFELPPGDFLRNAFRGGRAWFARGKTSWAPTAKTTPASSQIDKPEKTCDGFTLYTTDLGSQAMLINMRGQVVHSWTTRFSEIWPDAPHVRHPLGDDEVNLWGFHLYPNGDLLVVLQGHGDTPYGYGLVKLDKDSRVLWKYSAHVHHDVDVAEDGTIYALTQEIVHEMPKGLESIPTPCLVDYLVLLSGAGKELGKIPILEAFQNSPYSLLLSALEKPGARHSLQPDADWNGDILHTNAVQVVSRERAARFPMFKPGQALISVRELDTIGVLDIESRAMVWAVRGPWRHQHDPQFLDNGRLLIFDNLGSPQGSRALEFDPRTRAFPWSYTCESTAAFVTEARGMSQRLANGNTLIVDSDHGDLIEVTPGKELVWLCSCHCHVPSARRYRPEQLSFLKGGERARPQRARP